MTALRLCHMLCGLSFSKCLSHTCTYTMKSTEVQTLGVIWLQCDTCANAPRAGPAHAHFPQR